MLIKARKGGGNMREASRKKEFIFISGFISSFILGLMLLVVPGRQVVLAASGAGSERERVVEVAEDGSEREIDYEAWKEEYQDQDETFADSSEIIQDAMPVEVSASESGQGPVHVGCSNLPKATSSTMTYTVTLNKSNGYATINGSLASIRNQTGGDFRFDSLYVDNMYVKSLGSSTAINTSIDMKNYSVGYHCIRVYINLYDNYGYYVNRAYDDWDYVPTYIYSKPSNSLSRYETYPKYLNYYTPASYSKDYTCNLYMDYRKKGTKKWKTRVMPYGNTTYKISGLKPGKTYQTRVYYAKRVTYNGKDYIFSGKKAPVRRLSKIVALKTGPAKLPIKSIRVNAYNVKRHRIRHYGYYTGVYLYTETVYTYKLRATVTMKKKPGIKGLWINGKRIRGNRRKYSRKLGSYMAASRPRGTYKIFCYSYSNKKYGRYSKMYRKTCRYR